MNGLVCTLASFLLLTVGQSTYAEDRWRDNIYLGLSSGLSFLGDNEVEGGDDVDYDLGYAIAGQVGFRHDQLRVEAELAFEQADVDSISGADFESMTLGISAYADLTDYATYKISVPYIGFGIANAWTEFDGDDDSSFTAHAEVGAAFPISDHVDIGPAYRFRWLDTDAGDLTDNQLIHQIRIAIRYHFGEP